MGDDGFSGTLATNLRASRSLSSSLREQGFGFFA